MAILKNYTNSGMLRAIEELIHSDRDRHILIRRLIDGITIEMLSEEFDMSVSQIKRIIHRNEVLLEELKEIFF